MDPNKDFRHLMVVCVSVVVVALTLAFAIEAAAGTARCAERGIRYTGEPWGWASGNRCWLLPTEAVPVE